MSGLNALLYDEARSTRQLKVACVAAAVDRDARNNRTKMVSAIEAIVQEHPNIELVLFGEMIVGWYIPGGSPGYHRQISETIPGETTRALASLAQKYRIYICFGISERDGSALYNSQVLLNPQGEIQAVHRKKNLKSGERVADYQPGSTRVTTTEIKGVKTGIVICSDTADPRTMWALIRGRFDLILHSLADDDQDDFVTVFQSRMYDSWLVTANRFGQEGDQFWPGLITVTDPLGQVRGTRQGQEQVLVHELRFADSGPWLKRIIRNMWVKVPLVSHVVKNWERAKSYL